MRGFWTPSGDVGVPEADELLLDVFAASDAYEMAEAFGGRHWTELPIRELLYHRQMLFTLSCAGLRAYLPAYLAAALTNERAKAQVDTTQLVLLPTCPDRSMIAEMGRRRSYSSVTFPFR